MGELKICGLKQTQEIVCCLENNINYVGFVFCIKSSRSVSFNELEKLNLHQYTHLNKVGVFVSPTIEELTIAIETGCNIIQAHLPNVDAILLAKQTYPHIQIILPFAINGIEDILNIKLHPLFDIANFILLDKPTKNHGGGGEVFDWNIFHEAKALQIYKIKKLFNKPFFLSGGINEQNIAQALQISPFIDLSSAVESQRGMKDLKKIYNISRLINTGHN